MYYKIMLNVKLQKNEPPLWPCMTFGRLAPWTYQTIFKLADDALFKMVKYVLLRSLRPELDGQMSCQIMESCVQLE
jgi:hypothetical protein